MSGLAASSALVRERMRRQRAQHTAPEMVLRRELHASGRRYRLHRRVLAGSRRSHDIVVPSARADTAERLHEQGWTQVMDREHEDPQAAAERVRSVVRVKGAANPTRATSR